MTVRSIFRFFTHTNVTPSPRYCDRWSRGPNFYVLAWLFTKLIDQLMNLSYSLQKLQVYFCYFCKILMIKVIFGMFKIFLLIRILHPHQNIACVRGLIKKKKTSQAHQNWGTTVGNSDIWNFLKVLWNFYV